MYKKDNDISVQCSFKGAEALGGDVRQLEHVQSLTHVTVMIFSTWKVHLYVPEVSVKPSPTVDTVDDTQSETQRCILQQPVHSPEVQKYMVCIMDVMQTATKM